MTEIKYSSPELEAEIRRIAREEIASLAGLVLRRTQPRARRSEAEDTDEFDSRLAEIFGELLVDFTTDSEPGQ